MSFRLRPTAPTPCHRRPRHRLCAPGRGDSVPRCLTGPPVACTYTRAGARQVRDGGRVMRCWMGVSLVVSALVALGISWNAVATEKDETAIGSVVTHLMDAWNQHDVHAFALVFAKTADFTNVRGMGASGRLAIEEFHAPGFQTIFKDSHLTCS